MSKAFVILWDDLPNGVDHQIGQHQISRRNDKIYIFGNNRDFPIPPGWRFIDAYIGLVNTDPKRSRMPLPQGHVDVMLPSGTLLSIDARVPDEVDVAKVMTPHMSGGVSNWAGIQLVFEPYKE